MVKMSFLWYFWINLLWAQLEKVHYKIRQNEWGENTVEAVSEFKKAFSPKLKWNYVKEFTKKKRKKDSI